MRFRGCDDHPSGLRRSCKACRIKRAHLVKRYEDIFYTTTPITICMTDVGIVDEIDDHLDYEAYAERFVEYGVR